MGDNITIQPFGQVAPDMNGAVQQGLDDAQHARAVQALHGLDLNDPDSANTAISGLVKAGAIDTATALSNLAWTRGLRAGAPGDMAALQGVIGGAQGGAPAAPGGQALPSPAPAPAVPPGGSLAAAAPAAAQGAAPGTAGGGQLDPAHAAETMTMAQQAAGELLATPAADRPARFAEIKADMIKRGVPEQAIDAVAPHISDDTQLQDLYQHYGEAAKHFQGVAAGGSGATPGADPSAVAPRQSTVPGGGAEPSLPAGAPDGASAANPQGPAPHQTTYSWTRAMIDHPEVIAAVGRLKSVGLDYSQLVDTAKAVEAPRLAKEAEIAAAPQLGTIAAETALKEAMATGKTVELARPDGSRLTLNPEQAALELKLHPGEFQTQGTQAAARASATGTEEGTAPYDMVQTVGAHGQPVYMTKQQFHDLGQTGGGVVGQGGTPANVDYEKGQASELDKAVGDASNPDTEVGLRRGIDQGHTIIGLANSIGNTGKYTPALADAAAKLGPILGGKPQDYATNVDLLRQNLAAGVKNSLGGMGGASVRNQHEFDAVTATNAKDVSPQDSIRLTGAYMVAANNQRLALNNFLKNYGADPQSQKSMAAAMRAWDASPQGRADILADPVFQGLSINGKPAVSIVDFKGKKVGVYNPYGGHGKSFTFPVQ